MVPISNRMKLIADMIPENMSVADIGCDHGFISIYLIKERHMPYCVALDINQGPLMRAKGHIMQYGLQDRIETRLSDGAVKLKENETDAAIIAGMGGRLITKILSDSMDKFRLMKYFVLSPQSDIPYVREFLGQNGIEIVDEEMIFDEGKYYTVIGCRYIGLNHIYEQAELDFGPRLIAKRHPVLLDYLQKEREKLLEIKNKLTNLSQSGDIKNEGSIDRIKQLEEKINAVDRLINCSE